ncbi:DUF4013 domain-containing protein [Methanobrevibacter sp.]|uniref:DUF4013 domain-containing protein n=1 Tax=Methanobrevibacter sp. TaxID=66852 RepID=UPI0026E0CDB9|nr:DUF4013 domain-containing protein [Methanobrevibacter sp.]MDO5859151.1 DUF4013 domain-containing protein [Methanobrevibacter sp.]
MEIMDIIKEAFIFPSQNLEKLVIYILLTFVMGIVIAGGIVAGVFGAYYDVAYLAITAILAVVALIISLIISGYQVGILKSGIDKVDDAPSFDWKNDLVTGILLLVVSIVYFIIPAVIIAIVALITNIPGQIINISQQMALAPANATVAGASIFSNVSESALASLGTSIAITSLIAVVLIIIFAFLYTMGESRLANTGDLGEALNIPESFRDISRIGFGKVLGVVLLMAIIIAVIQSILTYLYGQVPSFSILSVIITPYLTFASQRAIGLLYSDIA